MSMMIKKASFSIVFFLIGVHGAYAGDLPLANLPLELKIGVEPNLVILLDNSGSMDWEIFTTDFNDNGLFTGKQPNGSNDGNGNVKHRDSDDDDGADCGFGDGSFTGYLYGVEFDSNAYSDDSDDCNTADDQSWRFRNSNFNSLYFNPEAVYEPWLGVDINGKDFANIAVDNAPNDPFNPTEWIDLTRHNSNYKNGGRTSSDRDNDGAPDGFRYYTWNDLNQDGLFDNGEETEHLIKDADVQTQQNFANWFSYWRSRSLIAKGTIGSLTATIDNIRVGYATINDTDNNIPVAQMNPLPSLGNKKNLLDEIYGSDIPLAGTPLRISLRNVGRYYECVADNIFNTNSCPIEPVPKGNCQQNYVILLSDGFYSGDSPDVGNTDSDGAGDFDGAAFADTISDTLADVSMHYYERDLSGLPNQVPTTVFDVNRTPSLQDVDIMHQHMSTYIIGFGVNGTLIANPPSVTDAFNWPDPFVMNTDQRNKARVDDLRHAAFNGRGELLNARNQSELMDALNDIIEQIQSGVGATSAVAFNTQEIKSGSMLYRAFFNTKTNSGDVVAQKINFDGTINPVEQWSAAEKLDGKIANNQRVIVTYKKDGVNTGGIPFQFANLLPEQVVFLKNPEPANASDIAENRLEYLRGSSEFEGLNFDKGDFRQRPMQKGKLGDSIHSAPVYVGSPPFSKRDSEPYPIDEADLYSAFKSSQKNRQSIVYIGANDGMLHALNADSGDEVLAYIPNILMSSLSQLTKPDYQHQMYVDLTPSINDVFIKTTSAGTKHWASVLVGGLGSGGKGYFALDVTDPAAFSSEIQAAKKVLWEFSEADDGGVNNSDLGFSFSEPNIVMTNADDNGQQRWAAIFGNGYNSTSVAGNAVLYIVWLEGGVDGSWSAGDFIKIDTGIGKAQSNDGTTPNGLATPRAIDSDGNGTVDYVYAGDYQGNLYRFDLSASNSSQWTQSASKKVLFKATGPDAVIQPITTQPIVIKHPEKNGFIVVATTGSWLTNKDAVSTDIQSIYGIWDDLSLNPFTSRSDLVEQEFENQPDKVAGYVVRTLSNNAIKWNQNKGWFIDLNVPSAGGGTVEFPGERAIRNLQLRGGILFVNSVLPKDPNSCAASPGGFQLAINPKTGSRPDRIIFDLNNDQLFTQLDNVNGNINDANIVSGTRFEDGVPADSSFIGNKRVTQLSDKSIAVIGTNTAEDLKAGRLSWRELMVE